MSARIFHIRMLGMAVPFLLIGFGSCVNHRAGNPEATSPERPEPETVVEAADPYDPVNAMLILPRNPVPGEGFRILATGGRNIPKAKITVSGPPGASESLHSKTGGEPPYWRIDDFAGSPAGNYKAILIVDKEEVSSLEFEIAQPQPAPQKGTVWKTMRGWDAGMETLYSAWINALFQGCDEKTSWPALHEVTRDKDRNFLYNYLSRGEDDPGSKSSVVMEPDCADHPFFLRAYFAWKLGLPFGYHVCDRGWLGKSPGTGQWITNATPSSKNDPVASFNSFLRSVMDGVHSGTARTALDNEQSDYYPVPLEREALRPGTVFADPYGHTLILVSWVPQTRDHPGLLLAADAQPDNTIAIKRFWKGNFLFSTSEVIGEPGFKAFRPVVFEDGRLRLMKNDSLAAVAGFAPFSLQQKNMASEDFYLAMERLINPKGLDPEDALADLIQALHEQLLVRVKSVANGEAYLQEHPGTVIPMPSGANGIFQAGGLWEDYSTPNRDLRLLIAMDAVLDFPERVSRSPEDFKISKLSDPENMAEKLQSLLDKEVSRLTITYIRSDGSPQELKVSEILERKEAFEMAYNPNDGIEIRWGAPENSAERATCHRRAPANQQKTMQSVRKWFQQRLHPPT